MTETACAVGIDVGGTKIAAGVVGIPSGRIFARQLIPTNPQRGGDAVLADVAELIGVLRTEAEQSGLPFSGVGVGVAELVTLDQQVASEFLIHWRGMPIVELLGGAAQVVLDADIRAAALAEAHLGAGRGATSFAYLTIGTGIGFVFVQGGAPWPGARGSAGTLGYSPLRLPCSACGAATEVLVERLASGPGLVSRLAQRGVVVERAEDVLAAAEAGRPEAIAVVREGATALGSVVGLVVDVLDPELIVVGGGLGLAHGLYRDTLEDAIRRSIWSDTNRDLAVVDAQLGVDAGLVGAALTTWVRQQPLKPKRA